MGEPEVFLDTSAFFAGIWSETGGSRQILRLGEAEVIQLYASERVLNELETTLREKVPDALGDLTVLLDRTGVEVLDTPAESTVEQLDAILDYTPDAEILATAQSAQVDWFITYDRDDFLGNNELKQSVDPNLGTAGDFLEQFRQGLD